MWKRTAQKGLWFTAGSLAQCRIYSKFLALQIKACELGLMPLELPAAGRTPSRPAVGAESPLSA
jgi:putative flavoprotein involved in K+ transport